MSEPTLLNTHSQTIGSFLIPRLLVREQLAGNSSVTIQRASGMSIDHLFLVALILVTPKPNQHVLLKLDPSESI